MILIVILHKNNWYNFIMNREELNKLTKEELKKILIAREIEFKNSFKKDELIELVFDSNEEFEEIKKEEINEVTIDENVEIDENIENFNQNNENDFYDNNKVDNGPNSVGKAGAILTIIGASFTTIFTLPTIIFPVFGIWTIISSLNFWKTGEDKVKAGILGLFFAGLIGGILILVSEKN